MAYLPLDENEFIREIVTPEGKIVQEIVSVNPLTGEEYRIARISETRYDPATGTPEAACHTQGRV